MEEILLMPALGLHGCYDSFKLHVAWFLTLVLLRSTIHHCGPPKTRTLLRVVFTSLKGLYVLQLLHAPKFQTYHGVLITFAFWQFSLFRLHRLKTGPHIVTWCQAEPADTHIQLAACFTTGLQNCQVSSTTGWGTIVSQVVEHNSNFAKVYGGWSQGVAGIIDQLITGEHPPCNEVWYQVNLVCHQQTKLHHTATEYSVEPSSKR